MHDISTKMTLLVIFAYRPILLSYIVYLNVTQDPRLSVLAAILSFLQEQQGRIKTKMARKMTSSI